MSCACDCFLWRVFYLFFLFLTGWEFRINSLQSQFQWHQSRGPQRLAGTQIWFVGSASTPGPRCTISEASGLSRPKTTAFSLAMMLNPSLLLWLSKLPSSTQLTMWRSHSLTREREDKRNNEREEREISGIKKA